MSAASTLLALRLAGQDHALESGRDYLLGSAEDCDLRLTNGVGAHHARVSVQADGALVVDLGSEAGTLHNGERVAERPLHVGDVLRLGEHEAIVVADDGTAAIVPIPALRTAATARRLSAVRIAAAGLRRHEEQSLHELLAIELRRAPWLALSLAGHLLLLLLLWLLLPTPTVGGREAAKVQVDTGAHNPEVVDDRAAVPEVLAEPPDAAFSEPEPTDPVEPVQQVTDAGLQPTNVEFPRVNVKLTNRPHAVAGTGTAIGGDLGGVGSGEFRHAIGDLRKSGLEIVFVFDSTGSMSRTIADTKSSIAQMLVVLQQLVPDARFGLVTYRDRGRNQEYLVRSMPLGLDFWRAVNFVQFVSADGGGDRPEDVRAGLHTAFEQGWQRAARRVVVLAGDAPPHADDSPQLIQEVRSFVQDGHSFVHTLVTTSDPAPTDTLESFKAIATAGRGLCERLDDRQRVLQRVLTFAFGREFDQDLTAVMAAVEREQQRVDVQALSLVRRGGPDLNRVLLRNPIPLTVWNALVRRPNRGAATQMLDLLAAKKTPEPCRQAIAAALQHIFELSLPPIDPFSERELTAPQLGRLRQLAERLPE